VGFARDGAHLLVTEQVSDTIDTFSVGSGGIAGPAVTTTLAAGTGPYGFAFDSSDQVIVTEAAFGGIGSYRIKPNGTLGLINQVADGQAAACWVALNGSGTHAYADNAHAGTVSYFKVAADGSVTLQSPAIAANVGGIPSLDLAVGADNATLYVFDAQHGRIDAASIGANGSLGRAKPAATGLSGDVGLTASDG
jgi:6-phosphogluconolactonase (cycloisomerase 2 family)